MISRTKGHEEEDVMPTIQAIVDALAQGDLDRIPTLVDDMGSYTPELLQQMREHIVEETGGIDVYGVPCTFHPNYEYKQLELYHFTDGSGMACEYALTLNGDLNDWTLLLRFYYEGDSIRVKFEDLHVL